MLDQYEVAHALKWIAKQPPGVYTVRELFGAMWPIDHRPRLYGRRFKAAVVGGGLPGVRWVGRRSNKSLVYDILPRPPQSFSR